MLPATICTLCCAVYRHIGPLCRYHTGCGFYINSALVFAAITATIWVYLLLALTGILTFPCGPDGTQICSTINGAHCLPWRHAQELFGVHTARTYLRNRIGFLLHTAWRI